MDCQRGSVLLVSLVLLTVLTLAGLTAISLSHLEEKITGNYRDQQIAFRAGEAALLEAEYYVANTVLPLSHFTSGCKQGLCFSGRHPNDINACAVDAVAPWQDDSLWHTSGRTKETTLIFAGTSVRAKYIIEFRCYLPREMAGPDPDTVNLNEWARFFRITALARGGSKQAKVMLQSTYKK